MNAARSAGRISLRLALPPLVLALALTGAARAEDASTPAQKSQAAAAAQPQTDGQLYCSNIANAASDARFAWQAKTLQDLQTKIDRRIAALEAKRAEYEEWMARKQAFLKKAGDGVVAIYAKMKPDAAAEQFAKMDEDAAAAVLTKLNPRTASAILSGMDAEHAARLTLAMSGRDAAEKSPGS
jgi:flagellar motility protein MotE (MotC chaperone)